MQPLHGNAKRKYVQANILAAALGSVYLTSEESLCLIPLATAWKYKEASSIVRAGYPTAMASTMSLFSQIMEGADLTHGGFYSYFKSKSDHYSEVFGCFFTDPNWKNCWKGIHVDLSSTDVGSQVVRAYLSRQHFENVENSCPMTALLSYVARSGKDVKRAFETAFKAMVSVLERSLLNKEGPNHVRALR